MSRSFHFYEPRHGHELPHDPFNAIVAPRPIGWISSHDDQGRLNLAPYSFFNAFNYTPPLIGFSSVGWKDSVRNIEATGEFCWNLATRTLAEPMNTSCDSVDASVVRISAQKGDGVEQLKTHLKDVMGFSSTTEGRFSARRRHLDALDRAGRALDSGIDQLHGASAGELLAEDLRAAQEALGEITGEFTADDLLGEIFGNFCIGK